MTITVWGRLNSVNVQKAIWALEEVGVAYEHVPLGGKFGGLDDPAYAALNPNKRVPTLRDGETVVWESHAIVRYLAAEYGAGTLWPAAPRQRTEADQWTDWTATTFQATWLRVFESYYRTPAPKRDAQAIAVALADANRLYRMLEKALNGRDFLLGSQLTYADVIVGSSMFRWMTMGIEREPMPNLERWYDRLRARPAFLKGVCVDFSDMLGVPLPLPPR
jgi:glutathione S-transferase